MDTCAPSPREPGLPALRRRGDSRRRARRACPGIPGRDLAWHGRHGRAAAKRQLQACNYAVAESRIGTLLHTELGSRLPQLVLQAAAAAAMRVGFDGAWASRDKAE